MVRLNIAKLASISIFSASLSGTRALAIPLADSTTEAVGFSIQPVERDAVVAKEGTVIIDHGGEDRPSDKALGPLGLRCGYIQASSCPEVLLKRMDQAAQAICDDVHEYVFDGTERQAWVYKEFSYGRTAHASEESDVKVIGMTISRPTTARHNYTMTRDVCKDSMDIILKTCYDHDRIGSGAGGSLINKDNIWGNDELSYVISPNPEHQATAADAKCVEEWGKMTSEVPVKGSIRMDFCKQVDGELPCH